MRVALSGIPGTGKSAVATALKKQGFTIIHLLKLARENKCIVGIDKERNSQLVDINKLDRVIARNFTTNSLVFFEGHFGHLLKTMDKVIILRCHPRELNKRLKKKNWRKKKIMENVEAEILDISLCEAVEQHLPENIFEIDSTKKTIDEVIAIIIYMVKKNFRPTKAYSIGKIDWLEEIFHENST